MQTKVILSKYPRISIRIPLDLHIQLNKTFHQRGEVSKAIVHILKEVVNDNEAVNRVKASITRKVQDGYGRNKRTS